MAVARATRQAQGHQAPCLTPSAPLEVAASGGHEVAASGITGPRSDSTANSREELLLMTGETQAADPSDSVLLGMTSEASVRWGQGKVVESPFASVADDLTPHVSLATTQESWSGLDEAGVTVLPSSPVMRQFQRMSMQSASLFIRPEEMSPTSQRGLGEGSFATVEEYVLRGQRVAVKRLRPELFEDQEEIKCFVTEGITLAKLDHRCIVRIIGLGFLAGEAENSIVNDSLFMAQELCEGGSLRDHVMLQMNRYNKIVYTYADALRWSVQIADGLAYLHSCHPQIIHRDLKLDNILLSGRPPHWDAKIADFGLHTTVKAAQSRRRGLESLQSTPNNSHGGIHRRISQEASGFSQRTSLLSAASSGTENCGSGEYDRYCHPTGLPQRAANELGTAGSTVVQPLSTAETEQQARAVPPLELRRGPHKILPPHVCHDLTGQTGSFLSMAPEVTLKQPYNEKADIFSLACCIVELFSKSIAATTVTVTGDPDELERLAHKVAGGFRRPLPERWPRELRQLLTECMAQDARDRPSAEEVAERLQAPELAVQVELMDDQLAARRGGCCVVQ